MIDYRDLACLSCLTYMYVSPVCSLKFAYQKLWRPRLRIVQLLWYVCDLHVLYQYACKNSRRTELRRILRAGFDVADTLIARIAEPVHVHHRTVQRLIRTPPSAPPPRISDVRLPTGFGLIDVCPWSILYSFVACCGLLCEPRRVRDGGSVTFCGKPRGSSRSFDRSHGLRLRRGGGGGKGYSMASAA